MTNKKLVREIDEHIQDNHLEFVTPVDVKTLKGVLKCNATKKDLWRGTPCEKCEKYLKIIER